MKLSLIYFICRSYIEWVVSPRSPCEADTTKIGSANIFGICFAAFYSKKQKAHGLFWNSFYFFFRRTRTDLLSAYNLQQWSKSSIYKFFLLGIGFENKSGNLQQEKSIKRHFTDAEARKFKADLYLVSLHFDFTSNKASCAWCGLRPSLNIRLDTLFYRS